MAGRLPSLARRPARERFRSNLGVGGCPRGRRGRPLPDTSLAEYDEQQEIPTKHLLTYFYELGSIFYYEFNKDRYGIVHNKGPGRNPSLVAKGFRN